MSTFHLVVALCLGLPLLANVSSKECMTTVEGNTWEYDENTDEGIFEVDSVDGYNAYADDTECQGYTWTQELCKLAISISISCKGIMSVWPVPVEFLHSQLMEPELQNMMTSSIFDLCRKRWLPSLNLVG
jgi:hypothetical protein